MIHLVPVPAAEIGSRWGWVRRGVEHVMRRSCMHGLAEDVYADLRGGVLHLFVISTEHEEPGWVIVQPKADPDGKVLHICLLWGEHMAPHEQDIYAELDKLAKSIGAKRIRFETTRNWQRGWAKPVRTVYEREL